MGNRSWVGQPCLRGGEEVSAMATRRVFYSVRSWGQCLCPTAHGEGMFQAHLSLQRGSRLSSTQCRMAP